MKHTKRFKNEQDLSVSVGNSYTEYHLMHILLDNFHQGVKYNSQIESHQEKLRIEGKFTDQKYPSILSLQTWSSPRHPLFLHTLSFKCTSKLCNNFINQFSVNFLI